MLDKIILSTTQDDMFGCESDYDSTSDYIGEDPVIREIIDDEELSDDTKDREVHIITYCYRVIVSRRLMTF